LDDSVKKVLLTGATGLIGSQSISFLLNRGFEVHAISSNEVCQDFDVIWHQQNLMDFDSTSELLGKIQPTHMLHFAWTVSPGQFWSSLDNLAWVEASLNLVRSFASVGGKRFVVAGTCAEYDWNEPVFDERESRLLPATLYGASKRGLYLILEAFANTLSLSFAWGYIFHIYGPKEHPNRFLPSIIRALLQKKLVPCSHGQQIRDFLHTVDVADAFVSLLESQVTGGVNIGSGAPMTLEQIARMAADRLKGQELLQFGALPVSKNEPLRLVPNTKRLNEEVEWRPKKNIDQGLEEVIGWWQKNL
jgi:nucleoside-diphosphate-sugar epimerase